DAGRNNGVRCERHQFGRIFASVVGIAFRPASVDPNVATDHPAQLLQLLQERTDASLIFRIIGGCSLDDADPPHALGLLRPRRERPCRRTAEQRDERAAPHSITSSARASSVGGTVSPSAFAVLRLITSSYLVGACTGRSAGFSPLRIRST